jgi:uncharacterized surface protein with fasciclin (FAS1) repeats
MIRHLTSLVMAITIVAGISEGDYYATNRVASNEAYQTTLLERLDGNPLLSNMSALFRIGQKNGLLNDTSALTTIFAPRNSAFAALTPVEMKKLFHPAKLADLQSVLMYHCAFGDILTTALKPSQEIQTMNGLKLLVTRNGSRVKVGKATVTTADIVAANGVMDIIDAVLQPSQPQPTPIHPTPPVVPTPKVPTPQPASPTPGLQYFCKVPQFQCVSTSEGQFPTKAACSTACKAPAVPTPPPTPPPSPPPSSDHPIYRCALSTGAHLTSIRSDCEGVPGATEEATLGYLSDANIQGFTHGLYRCSMGGGNDYMVSVDPGCEGATTDGLLGYIWNAPGSSAPSSYVDLYRCRMAGGHHMTSTSATCEGGGSSEGTMGYALSGPTRDLQIRN